MPLSFPASPTVGQTSTQNGRTYSWTGYAWELVAAAGGSGLSWSSVPASSTATGTAGQIAYDNDSGFFYVATATNTWKRAALSSWVPFTPAVVSGLQLWLDASDTSTLYDATSGGSLVAADGAVARWEDKSGNARHFTQTTSGSRPTRKTSQQNGRDALLFDGSNDHLIGGDYLDLDGTNQLTLFLVIKTPTASATNYELINKRDSTGTDSGWFVVFGPSAQLQTGLANNGSNFELSSDGAVAANSGAVLTVKTVAGSAQSATAQYKNGSLIASTVAYNATQVAANISKAVYLGILEFTPGAFYRPFAGNFCEVVAYSAALSDVDRANVEAYLMTKWGIT